MTENLINHDYCLKDLGYSNYRDSMQLPRHRWYYFKEGFSPYLVERAIEDSCCKENDNIVDPFSGSGTVPLVALSKGFNGVGFEVNPFLVFLSKTKFIQVNEKKVKDKSEYIEKGISKGKESYLEKFSTFSKKKGSKKWLFNTAILRAFEGGWNSTLRLEKNSRNIFQLGLIGAAMDTCNATRDGKCLRYRKDWEELNFTKKDFLANFQSRMATIEHDLEENPIETSKGRIVSGDSRVNVKKNLPFKFKLCVTSPPYLNSFDYSDIYRPELFLGKFLKSNKNLSELRLKTVRSHVQVGWKPPLPRSYGLLYEEVFNLINQKKDVLWNKRIPMMIQAYFEDMNILLKTLKLKADEKASLWLVVSTSAYAGIEIPVDLIIAEIGTKAGWFLREVGVLRHLRSSNQYSIQSQELSGKKLRESVIIFDASERKP